MLDGVEVLALQIPFMDSCEGCLKGSPVIKYTNLACLKVLLLFVFAIYGLLWLIGRKRIQNPVKHLWWTFFLN